MFLGVLFNLARGGIPLRGSWIDDGCNKGDYNYKLGNRRTLLGYRKALFNNYNVIIQKRSFSDKNDNMVKGGDLHCEKNVINEGGINTRDISTLNLEGVESFDLTDIGLINTEEYNKVLFDVKINENKKGISEVELSKLVDKKIKFLEGTKKNIQKGKCIIMEVFLYIYTCFAAQIRRKVMINITKNNSNL